jgi:hypothetical protein
MHGMCHVGVRVNGKAATLDLGMLPHSADDNLAHWPMSAVDTFFTMQIAMHPSSNPSTSRFTLLRLLAQLPRPTRTYTPEEVRLRLQLDETGHPRTAAVHAAAAQCGIWSSLLTEKVAFDLGRSAARLPTVVYWYRQGVPPHEIGRRLSRFGGAWDADRAIGVASELIARALNVPEAAASAA